MPYVMVPVPEDQVEEVMQFILRAISNAALEPWDADAIGAVFHDVDEATRSLLAFVARSAADGIGLSDAEAAGKIQMSVRETMGIANELNTMTRESNRPALITVRIVPELLPNGRTTDKRMLLMDPDLAAMVRAAEQAELASAPHPLNGGAA
jgi:hypothetical protein